MRVNAPEVACPMTKRIVVAAPIQTFPGGGPWSVARVLEPGSGGRQTRRENARRRGETLPPYFRRAWVRPCPKGRPSRGLCLSNISC